MLFAMSAAVQDIILKLYLLDGKAITNNQLLNGSSNVIIETAVLTCPDQVPEKIVRKVRKTIDERSNQNEKKNN